MIPKTIAQKVEQAGCLLLILIIIPSTLFVLYKTIGIAIGILIDVFLIIWLIVKNRKKKDDEE
jgi:hypothetical protein